MEGYKKRRHGKISNLGSKFMGEWESDYRRIENAMNHERGEIRGIGEMISLENPSYKNSIAVFEKARRDYNAIVNDSWLEKVGVWLGFIRPEGRLQRKIDDVEETNKSLERCMEVNELIWRQMNHSNYMNQRRSVAMGELIDICDKGIEAIGSKQEEIVKSYNSTDNPYTKAEIETELDWLGHDREKINCLRKDAAATICLIENSRRTLQFYKTAAQALFNMVQGGVCYGRRMLEEMYASKPFLLDGTSCINAINRMYSAIETVKSDFDRITEANMKQALEISKYRFDPDELCLVSPRTQEKSEAMADDMELNLEYKAETVVDMAREIIEGNKMRKM